MKRCAICGEIVDDSVTVCPVCKATKFVPIDNNAEIKFACVHEVGVAKGLDEEVVAGLRANFEGECTEVGMYLAMARVAEREGYPEIAEAYKRYAYEEAEHASKFAELLGECITDSTKKNLELRVAAETGACEGKLAIAKRAKELNQGNSIERGRRRACPFLSLILAVNCPKKGGRRIKRRPPRDDFSFSVSYYCGNVQTIRDITPFRLYPSWKRHSGFCRFAQGSLS